MLMENYFILIDLEYEVTAFINQHNDRWYYESLENTAPAEFFSEEDWQFYNK